MKSLILLTLSLVLSSPTNVINLINNERNSLNLTPITYNYTRHDELKEFVNSIDNNWFYETGNQTFPEFQNRTNSLKGSFLPGYLFRDTASKTASNSIARIIQFRINQRDCIRKDCRPNYKNHTYCVKTVHQKDHQRCAYVWAYYPKILSMKSIACVMLDIPGKFTPKNLINKQLAFWCYE